MREVVLVALDGALDAAIGVTLDVLSVASRLAGERRRRQGFAVRVLGSSEDGVTTSAGYRREVDAALGARLAADVVILLAPFADSADELDEILARPDVALATRAVAHAHERGALVVGSCSATFVLAKAGLLDGHIATTAWFLAPHFRRLFPRVELTEGALVVPTGRVVTAGAALAHADLMLWLVEHLAGAAVAELTARTLVLDARTSQTRYVALERLGERTNEVRRAERFLRDNLARDITLADVARAARTSARTLARRFEVAVGMSPLRFLRRLRAERAAHLLATTRRSLEEIAPLVGYRDPVALRKVLRRSSR